MRVLAPVKKQTLKQLGVIFISLCWLGFSGCHSDRVAVNPKDPRSPQYAYRLDELALLQMATDDIMNMERKKQYGQIYDDYASRDFKKNVSRRRFLIMSNCVETYLGGLQEFDINDLGFHREFLKDKHGSHPIDILTRRVQRERGSVDEQLTFIAAGFNFKLNGLYWISKDKTFLQCIADSPQIEASTEPQPLIPPAPEGTTSTTAPVVMPSAPGTPAEQKAPETPAQPEVGPPVPTELKPPTETKPGAGAVQETRPTPPPPEKPAEPTTEPRGMERKSKALKPAVAMPLDIHGAPDRNKLP